VGRGHGCQGWGAAQEGRARGPKGACRTAGFTKAWGSGQTGRERKGGSNGATRGGKGGFTLHRAESRGELQHKDLLSRFIVLQQTSEAQQEHFLRDVVTNFIVAGRDTSALTLTWFFWQLSHHPEVEDKILAELDSIDAQPAGSPSSTALEPQSLQEAASSGGHTECKPGNGANTERTAGALGDQGRGAWCASPALRSCGG